MLTPGTPNYLVDNSAFVNSLTSIALAAPEEAFSKLGHLNTDLHSFAENIYVPYDSVQNYHPQYDGYHSGRYIGL